MNEWNRRVTFGGFEDEIGSFVQNTKALLTANKTSKKPIQIEYHFITFDEVYNKAILTADRYTCDACGRLLGGNWPGPYEFFVISKPYYQVPQEICFRFPCYYMQSIDELAFDFAALVSTLTRVKIVPIGIRRIADIPKHETSQISDWGLVRVPAHISRYSAGIIPEEFYEYIKGLANIDIVLTERIFNALKMYYLATLLVEFNPSNAYVLLVSAVETLAQKEIKMEYGFEDVKDFHKVGMRLNEITLSIKEGSVEQRFVNEKIKKIKSILIKKEHFTSHKVREFIKKYLDNIFWETYDEKYGEYNDRINKFKKEDLDKCISQIYHYRSKYVHAGVNFPSSIIFCLKGWTSGVETKEMLEILFEHKKIQLPTFTWFERLVHFVLIQYLKEKCAPTLKEKRDIKMQEQRKIFKMIDSMSPNVKDSLSKLVYETAKFAGAALIGPYTTNSQWADSSDTVKELEKLNLISCDGYDMGKSSVIRDQETGTILGDYFLGRRNPFRHYNLLLLRNTTG